jgi:hypothetical protein
MRRVVVGRAKSAMRKLRRAHVLTYSALAWIPACTSTSAEHSDAGDAASADGAACPDQASTCAVGSADLACATDGYPYSMSCLGGAWCAAYSNPPPPEPRSGECPATPPTNGTPCSSVAEGLVKCAYQCGPTQAYVVCNQLGTRASVWCGVAPSSCTLIGDGGSGDASSADASSGDASTSD